MSTSLALYRTLIPAHFAVPDPTVEAWLTLAATRHSAAAFGVNFVPAMIMWTAAHLDPLVQAGQAGALEPGCDPCASAAPAMPTPGKIDPESAYWLWYLDYRDSRAAGAPQHIGV